MTAVSRRRLLQLAAAGVAATSGRVSVGAPTPSLGAIAARNGYLFGAAAAEVIDTDAPYRDLYVTQTKIITTDVALKIGWVAPQPGPKNFAPADRLLAFCDQHKIAMRGHCLMWNEWNPAWVTNMTANERRMYFDSYIDEVVTRYSGKLQSWDIVNEPFWPGHNAPGGFRIGPWYDAFGPDYIRRAFERAADRTRRRAWAGRSPRAVEAGRRSQKCGREARRRRPAGSFATTISARPGSIQRIPARAGWSRRRYLHHRIRCL